MLSEPPFFNLQNGRSKCPRQSGDKSPSCDKYYGRSEVCQSGQGFPDLIMCVCVCPDFDHIFVLPLKSYYFLYNHFDLIIPTKSQNKVLVLCIFLLIRIKIDTQP